ncbi:ATP-binding Cassette (ABC) Superfamily [Phytophthora infestans T30-4]|uniref:ATP-binding Cassette (ABC) Superfamily n=1 Tax=Phytophthora infestans (strain T30-4) TaxID=403677 RepID=D0NQ86_PHYIT|nr:ATP-binding Cassette (ABC) Superfamily [Phytophthora infestans T30-4]EEY62818.1 ATP-binding Cassette (ABC) Superfamily [Phytophthora infestans T30-4]|eukprot:XP_002898693.1 ATP-binding Cassette (ABC) Superfamily [Phytophthora infestans T30-4]
MSCLLPETETKPPVREGRVLDSLRSLSIRNIQDPYSHGERLETMTTRNSTLDTENLNTMLNGGLERFYKKYHHLSRKINLQLPTPEIRFQELSFSVQAPSSTGSHSTVGTHLAQIFTPWKRPPTMTKHVLHPMTGVIKPGSMTLLLANPGAGKSTFLKALAGKLQNNSKTEIGGEIRYAGLRGAEIDLVKLVGLVDQTDNHIPTLTVRETFKFADMCMNGRPKDQHEELRDIAKLRTELFLQILGLENCADTVVGNALLRGVSGGERRRVTVGEMLVGGQSLFLCDEISTGLDSAATFDIVKALRTWCKTLDFLIEVTSGRGQQYANGNVPKQYLAVTAEDFHSVFTQSSLFKKTQVALNKSPKPSSPANSKKPKRLVSLARKKGKSEFGLAFIPSTRLLLNRQRLIWLRDPPLLYGKLIEALVIGLVIGMIYFDAKRGVYLRMCFFNLALFQRQAWQQITISFQLRKVFYKQRPRNFFRTASYAIAEALVQIPHAICAYMTMLSAFSPSVTVGQALAGLSVCFFLLFSGNIILADLIPEYWIWMYWFNPIAWALRSLILSEFSSDRYPVSQRDKYLDSFSISQDTEYIWFGVGILLAYYLLFTTLNGLALHFIRHEKFSGVSVKTSTQNAPVDLDQVLVEIATPAPVVEPSKEKSGGLPFTPSNLCVKDLEYFVTLPSGEEKQLLRGVTAHFEPGRMVALMGSSGAGKTTLMDVIAGRKTGGRIVGEIMVNGEPKNPATFSRIAAYCEQMDIHSEAASIYEALVFSADLRLPPTFSKEQRMNLVNETLELLELQPIASAMIGNLSVEQKKRVTIGVEVVANPSILFLDEPTSGLDARSAIIVMRGVQSIARTGRTILCTIHQPSISIFELFDGLLLLQRGGYTAYFGDLGEESSKMLEYFATIPGTLEIRPQYNPATYMMEVIGAGIGRGMKDYSVEYTNSELGRTNRERTLQLCEVSSEFTRHSTLNYTSIATGFWNQFSALAKKQQLTYWRNPQYNFMRMFLFPLYAVIFGTTFYQLPVGSVKKINSHVGLIYNSMDFIGVMNLMTVLEVTCAERAVFYRERMSNYYGPLPYSLSLWFAEVPYLVVVICLFVVIEYWLVGWNDNAEDFFFFLFIFYLYTSACTYIGQWMSALMPNEKVANVAVGALSCLCNLFAGYLLPRTAMKPGYKWFQYLVPSSYSLAALVGVQFGNNQDIVLVDAGNTTVQMTVSDYIAHTYDFHPELKYNFMAGLLVIWAVLQVAIYLTFKYVSHLKR